MMADVKWIKLATNLFDNRKIRQIECLPDGDSIIVVWVKLMCLAGNINDSGFIYFTKEIPYTDQMLAAQFNRPLTTIQFALKTFEQFGMIELIDNVLHISNWEKYQNIEGLDKIREQNRLRKAAQRERQKALPAQESRDSHVTVTQSHATEEDKEKEEEKEKDKELYIAIISYLNEKAGTNYKSTTAKTKSAINGRVAEGFKLDDFKTVIDKKCEEWLGDEKMEKYLRPETLFGTKFEGYLNQKQSSPQKQGGRKEMVPAWMNKDREQAFDDRLKKDVDWLKQFSEGQKTVENDPDLKARADALRQSFQVR